MDEHHRTIFGAAEIHGALTITANQSFLRSGVSSWQQEPVVMAIGNACSCNDACEVGLCDVGGITAHQQRAAFAVAPHPARALTGGHLARLRTMEEVVQLQTNGAV